jgi:UDP-N-acetylmuramyl tripeptide synthase
MNLFRDQLDRYGEVDSIAEGWREALAAADARGEAPTLVLNGDDPSVTQIVEAGRPDVVTFGVDDPAAALPGVEHASDARFCRCGGAFEYTAVYIGHVGVWRCSSCGEERRKPDVSACGVRLGEEDASFTLRIGADELRIELPQTGLYSIYNALAAAAAAHALGLSLDAIERAMEAASPAFGRQERFEVSGRRARVLLAKNPAGLNEVIRALTASEQPVRLLILLNDGIQDGRDVSWIYDADLERLAGHVADVVVSGSRADDLALRLHLAGIETDLVQSHIATALDEALSRAPAGTRLDVVATYTAMVEVREALASRAGAAHYWETPA